MKLFENFFLGFPVGGTENADGLELDGLLNPEKFQAHQFQQSEESHDEFPLGIERSE